MLKINKIGILYKALVQCIYQILIYIMVNLKMVNFMVNNLLILGLNKKSNTKDNIKMV